MRPLLIVWIFVASSLGDSCNYLNTLNSSWSIMNPQPIKNECLSDEDCNKNGYQGLKCGLQICCISDNHCGSYISKGTSIQRKLMINSRQESHSHVYCNREQSKCEDPGVLEHDDRSEKFECYKGTCCTKDRTTLDGVCPNGEMVMKNSGCTRESCEADEFCVHTVQIGEMENLEKHDCCKKHVCPSTGLLPYDRSPTSEFFEPRPCLNAQNGGCKVDSYCETFSNYTRMGQIYGKKLCCPFPYSASFYAKSRQKLQTNMLQIARRLTPHEHKWAKELMGKECQTHDDCSDTEFCDKVVDPRDKWTKDHSFALKFCFLVPRCGGTPVRGSSGVGIMLCKEDNECGGENYYCDKKTKTKTISGTNLLRNGWGVCCSFECPWIKKSYDIARKSDGSKIYGQRPQADTSVARCERDNQCLNSTINEIQKGICTATKDQVNGLHEVGDNKLCCNYPRNSPKCKNNENNPYPMTNSLGDVILCTIDDDCNKINDTLSENEHHAECFDGMCCWADLCPDGLTVKKREKKCSPTMRCSDVEGAAMCQPFVENGKDAPRCCPLLDLHDLATVQKQMPYCTQRKCKGSWQCGGHSQFCRNGVCCYLGKQRIDGDNHRLASKELCSEFNSCPESNLHPVCVYQDPDPKSKGECFMDPFIRYVNDYEGRQWNKTYGIILIVVGILFLLFGVIAVLSFVCYRSKNFFDKYKPKRKKTGGKKKNSDKDSKQHRNKKKKAKTFEKSEDGSTLDTRN